MVHGGDEAFARIRLNAAINPNCPPFWHRRCPSNVRALQKRNEHILFPIERTQDICSQWTQATTHVNRTRFANMHFSSASNVHGMALHEKVSNALCRCPISQISLTMRFVALCCHFVYKAPIELIDVFASLPKQFRLPLTISHCKPILNRSRVCMCVSSLALEAPSVGRPEALRRENGK